MCKPKAPKIEQPKEKKVEVLHNPFLDGSFGISGLRIGRKALRIDLGSGANTPTPGGGGVVAPTLPISFVPDRPRIPRSPTGGTMILLR